VTTFRAKAGDDDDARRSFALVSWYGRADEGYSDRGGRVSFVDVSRMTRRRRRRRRRDGTTTAVETGHYPYEHVLLVDDRFCTLPNLHVGGIEQVNGTLYVADSRKGHSTILEFDLVDGLYEVPPHVDAFLGHRYVLRTSGSSFRSPITPSFMSYDADRDVFVVGTYANCVGKMGVHSMSGECFDRPENRLVWLKGGDAVDANAAVVENDHRSGDNATSAGAKSGNVTSRNATLGNVSYGSATGGDSRPWHYISEMQGAASAIVGDSAVVWVSSSYGPIGDSHLHLIRSPILAGGGRPGGGAIRSTSLRMK